MARIGPQSETSYIITVSIWICARLLIIGVAGGSIPIYFDDTFVTYPVFVVFRIAMIVSLVWCCLSCVLNPFSRKAGEEFRGRYFALEFAFDGCLAIVMFAGIGSLSSSARVELGGLALALLLTIASCHTLVGLAMLYRAAAYGAFRSWPLVNCCCERVRHRPSSETQDHEPQVDEMRQIDRRDDLEAEFGFAPRYRASADTEVIRQPAPIHEMFTTRLAERRGSAADGDTLPKYERQVDAPPPPYVREIASPSESDSDREGREH